MLSTAQHSVATSKFKSLNTLTDVFLLERELSTRQVRVLGMLGIWKKLLIDFPDITYLILGTRLYINEISPIFSKYH